MNNSQYKKQLLEKMAQQRKNKTKVAPKVVSKVVSKASSQVPEVVNKPESDIKAISLVIDKLKKITPDGRLIDAMDFSSLPNINGNFLEELILRLTSIETLLNAVNDKLTVFTASD